VSSRSNYLVKSPRNVYYFQIRTPKRIISLFNYPKSHYRKSLQTKDFKTALRLSKRIWLMYDKLAQDTFQSVESYTTAMKLLDAFINEEIITPEDD